MSLKKDGAYSRKLGKPGPQPSGKPSQPSDKPAKKLNWSMEDLLNKLPQSNGDTADGPAQSEVGQLKQIVEFASALKSTQDQSFDLSRVIEGQPDQVTAHSKVPQQSAVDASSAKTQPAPIAAQALASSEQQYAAEPQALAEEPEQYAAEPQALAEEPEQYAAEPQALAEEPEQYAAEPQALAEEPEQYAAEPQALAEEPEQYAAEPQALAEEPEQYAAEPQALAEEPEQYAAEPQALAEEPEQYAAEPQAVAEEPEQYAAEPQALAEEPEQYAAEPQALAEEPEQYAAEPQAVAEEPEQYAVEPHATSEEQEQTIEPQAVAHEPERHAVELHAGPTEPAEPAFEAVQKTGDAAAADTAKAYSLADLDSIKSPAASKTVGEAGADEAEHSPVASLLKKAIAKKSEILSKPEPEPAAANDTQAPDSAAGSQQPPSQFNRKEVLQKLGKPGKEDKPAPADSDKPVKEEKLSVLSRRRAEPETKSKFVQDLLSAARASKAAIQGDKQDEQASIEEARKRHKEKHSRTERMKTLIDAVPHADEVVVSPATREKTKAAKEAAKNFVLAHKRQLIAGVAGLIVAYGAFAAWQSQDKARLSAQINQKIDAREIENGLNLCNTALSQYPGDALFHCYKGRLLWRMIDYNGALSEFDQAVKLSPNNPEILRYRGILCVSLSKMSEAAADFDRVFADNSYIASLPAEQRAILYQNRAGAEMGIGNNTLAMKYITEAIKLSPKTLKNYVGLAWVDSSLKHYGDAIKQWSFIISRAPKDPLNYVERARVEFLAKQTRAADEDIARSISIRPTSAAYDLKATREYDLRQMSAALADLNRAVNLEPKNTFVRRQRVDWLIASKDFSAALNDFDVLQSLGAPDDERLCLIRAQTRISAGQYAKAADDYTKLLKLHPGDDSLRIHRAECYEKAGDYSLATEDYAYLINKKPDAGLYLKRASVYLKHGNPDLAEADFAEALKLQPNSPAFYLSRGLAYGGSRLYDQALVDMRHVLELQPNNQIAREKLREYQRVRSIAASVGNSSNLPPLPANLDKNNPAIAGYQLMQSGHTELALKKFAEAIKKDPNNAALRKYLANAMVLLGRPADAATQFQALAVLNALDSADELKWAQALIDSDQKTMAIKVYQRRLMRDPGDADARLILAKIYLEMGPSADYLLRQVCQTGISLAKTKDEENRFRGLLNVKKQNEDMERAQKSGTFNQGGG